ncbi:MAG: hypothetical protein ACI8RZ_001740 [Myxococcota bacterium]|jgi:hypothetical protein
MTHLKPPLLGALADAAGDLTAIEAISLLGNSVAGDRMSDFLSRLGSQLTYLNLDACSVSNRELEEILAADNLTQLRGLSLSSSRFDSEGLDALMQSANLPKLELLNLHEVGYQAAPDKHNHYTRAQQRGHRHLRRAAWAGQLTEERPDALKLRCLEAGLKGYSRGNKLIVMLLSHWDALNPAYRL